MDPKRNKFNTVVGLTLIGGCFTGIVCLLAAFIAISVGEYAGMGLCLIAAALSFGLLSNAVLRT